MIRDGTQNHEGRGRRLGRPRSFDRDATIDAATACYWREGPHGISLNEVCRRVNVSKPGIYREFGGEDGLLAAVINRYRDQVVLPLIDLLASDLPFDDVLRAILTAATTKRDGPMGCLIAEARLGRHLLGPLAAERLDAVSMEELEPAFAASYLDAQFRMLLIRFHRGEDPETVARHTWLALQVLLAPDQPAR